MSTHPHTVVGAFGSVEEARRAAETLASQGFPTDRISVADHDTTTTENPTGEFPENDVFHHLLMAIAGPPATAATEPRYDARRHGFVAAHVDTFQEAEQARDVLDGAGAVDVHELGIGHRGDTTTAPARRSRILEARPGEAPRPLW